MLDNDVLLQGTNRRKEGQSPFTLINLTKKNDRHCPGGGGSAPWIRHWILCFGVKEGHIGIWMS